MTKEIILQIKGLRYEQAEPGAKPEPIEMVTPATYYQKNGKHYVMYEEVMEGFSETTKNRIKISSDSLEISRKGSMNTTMSFEKNKKKVSTYCTPFGSMLMGIQAHEIEITEKEERIEVHLAYRIELNDNPVADCDLQLCIQSQKEATHIL
ncbi:MAG: DUF1934 domain-containing protein [Lachnospiraceae bacterium]